MVLDKKQLAKTINANRLHKSCTPNNRSKTLRGEREKLRFPYLIEQEKIQWQTKPKFDLLIKIHGSSYIMMKCTIDEHLYNVIRNIIEAYHVKMRMEQVGEVDGNRSIY
jgi:hypothetical protein